MAALHHTLPVVAAAVGLYFFNSVRGEELGDRQRILEVKPGNKVMEKGKSCKIPKLAPQFDGLYSFETLVG